MNGVPMQQNRRYSETHQRAERKLSALLLLEDESLQSACLCVITQDSDGAGLL